MVFYEAPHKLPSTLEDLLAVLGDRRIALVRELTKIHEEVIRTTLSEAAARYADGGARGEFVLVVEGAPEPEEAPADEDAEIFAAARAWDAAEEAEQKARKRARAKWKEGLLWLLTLALIVILPNLTYWLGISEVYAVVVTVAFLITGFLLDNWHPGWMLFLTIPLYYVLIFGR